LFASCLCGARGPEVEFLPGDFDDMGDILLNSQSAKNAWESWNNRGAA